MPGAARWRLKLSQVEADAHLSFLDAGVDGVQQVGAVLVALGQLGQLFAHQLPLVVAHHPLEGRVHVLEETQGNVKSVAPVTGWSRERSPTVMASDENCSTGGANCILAPVEMCENPQIAIKN